MTRLLAIVVLALALAGCGDDDQAASTKPSSPPSMETTADCMPIPGASTDAKTSPANDNAETMYLTNVTLSSTDCSDKVVFDFEEQAPGPGFDISYQPASTAKVEDGSGNAVEIDGDAFLVVRLTPAMTAKIDGEQVTKTYTGPRRLPGDPDSAVRDVVKTGDFEAQVTWVIGLDENRPFKIGVTDSSLTVEIDRS
jgi:hypothetical protein